MGHLALAIVLATASALVACKQQPDIVAFSNALDTGGSGGTGFGSGGMGLSGGSGGVVSATGGAGEPQDPTCNTAMGIAFGLLVQVAANDCTFDPLNRQVGALLLRHIFSQPLADFDPEAAPPDVVCNRASRPPDFFAWARPSADDATLFVMCPVWCASLEQWIEDNGSALQDCLPDAGI